MVVHLELSGFLTAETVIEEVADSILLDRQFVTQVYFNEATWLMVSLVRLRFLFDCCRRYYFRPHVILCFFYFAFPSIFQFQPGLGFLAHFLFLSLQY